MSGKKKASFLALRNIELRSAGLSVSEIKTQASAFGKNEIVEIKGIPWWKRTVEIITDPMIILLFFAGTLFLALGSYREAVTLLIAMLPLIFMDLYLHRRTEASLEALKSQLSNTCQVRRENIDQTISPLDLVPGDLLILKTGDFLSADGYFEDGASLQIDEALLTGESLPQSKKIFKIPKNKDFLEKEVVIDNEYLGYAGTRVLRGSGLLRILQVGRNTEYGIILGVLEQVPQEKTPLQKSTGRLVRDFAILGFIFCIVLAAVRLYQGKGWLDALLSSAVLAVAAMPEEFPIVFTFFLGVGVYRLAKQNALVRRAVTVENIGRVQRICTDKTGTLTLGELQLIQVEESRDVTSRELLAIARLASDESPSDPVDIAIDVRAEHTITEGFERMHTFPFTEDRKRETCIVRDVSGKYFSYVKGAPETILSMCLLKENDKNFWKNKITKSSGEGCKVLACALKYLKEDCDIREEPIGGYTFAGLLIFSDPIRSEVLPAVEYCKSQEIKILMLTGDHPSTAMAIAKNVGIGGLNPLLVSAEDAPEEFTFEAIQSGYSKISKIDVIARCTPLQKLWVVQALKAKELVAVTGDGVNDVPALQAADIGIAMGKRGARSAREAASIVIADDNFATIINAIREGRQLFKNLNKSFEYLVIIQVPLVLGAAIVPILGYSLLYLPIHLVWMELILHPTSLFAFQMNTPQKGDEIAPPNSGRFFMKSQLKGIVVESTLLLGAVLFSYILGIGEGKGDGHARASAISILCLASLTLLVRGTRLKNKSARSVFVVTGLSSIALIQIPFLAAMMDLIPLDLVDWLRNLLMVIFIFSVVPILRHVFKTYCWSD